MSYFMATALGRMVPNSDWKSSRADTILKLLYGVSLSPFNPNNEPVDIATLVQATGLDLVDLHDVIDHYLLTALESGGLVEVTRDAHDKPTGVRLILPAEPP